MQVSENTPRRTRDVRLPSERDWERSAVLQPLPGSRQPELIGDGSRLPFPPGALTGAPAQLDPTDPDVQALHAHLSARATPTLDGWRALARTDGEALFAFGRPPQLLTITARRGGLRRRWRCVGPNATGTLRAMRDGIRASSWRVDPRHETAPEETTLRVLVTEQAFASGQLAEGRLLAPNVYEDEHELVLTMFITPRPGFQTGSGNPETPVRIALARPVGQRRLIDGALPQLFPAMTQSPS